MDEPSLTTVPDGPTGQRTYRRLLAGACLLALITLGIGLYQAIMRKASPEEIAEHHFQWPSGFTVVRATESRGRADAWLVGKGPTGKPSDGVRELYAWNQTGSTALKPLKKGSPAPLKMVSESFGRRFGVEYDAKRREYHLWAIDAP